MRRKPDRLSLMVHGIFVIAVYDFSKKLPVFFNQDGFFCVVDDVKGILDYRPFRENYKSVYVQNTFSKVGRVFSQRSGGYYVAYMVSAQKRDAGTSFDIVSKGYSRSVAIASAARRIFDDDFLFDLLSQFSASLDAYFENREYTIVPRDFSKFHHLAEE